MSHHTNLKLCIFCEFFSISVSSCCCPKVLNCNLIPWLHDLIIVVIRPVSIKILKINTSNQVSCSECLVPECPTRAVYPGPDVPLLAV